MADITQIRFDFIVVGSGPSGAMCAQTLVEAGKTVLMLDMGKRGIDVELQAPDKNFDEIRRTENNQHHYFLGKHFDGAGLDSIKSGSQLTPARKYVTERSQRLNPLVTDDFYPVESLALGGLGAAWGLGCYCFSDSELVKTGLDPVAMKQAYQVIADRIGIAYTEDDVLNYTMAGITHLQPAIQIDDNNRKILESYKRKKETINRKGFFMGKPALALLTASKEERQSTGYTNMDFYANHNASAYRPILTIAYLETKSNFVYRQNSLVTAFEEGENGVTVNAFDADANQSMHFNAQKLVLACNVMATARIVLRSFGQYDKKIPLLSNPYNYLTCLQWRMLGKVNAPERTSTAQLNLFHDPDGRNENVAMASLYSYHTLLLYRLAMQVPTNFKDARVLMQYVAPAMVIAGIHHPDEVDINKYILLKKNPGTPTGDVLEAVYKPDEETIARQNKREKAFGNVLVKLGVQPLKKVNPGFGASAHYAGTLPFNDEGKPLSIKKNGQLAGTKAVFVADASGFCYLPAKGLTFSLMAYAHLTAINALKNT